MNNETLDLKKHPTSKKDAFWYWLIGMLGKLQAFIIQYQIKEPIWRSFDGRVYVPRTMSDQHLGNTVALIERRFGEGEPMPPQYQALTRELQHRKNLEKIRTERQRAQFAAREVADIELRNAQLRLVPDNYTPEGWFALHELGSGARSYRHESGALVSLRKNGMWCWWRAKMHHVACKYPTITLQEALDAAVPTTEGTVTDVQQ